MPVTVFHKFKFKLFIGWKSDTHSRLYFRKWFKYKKIKKKSVENYDENNGTRVQ